jgi:ABC-type cobalamin transport system ATPase subunit
MERLKLIDEGLQTVSKEMSLLVSKIERLREDFEVARKTAHEKRKLLEDFERENEVVHLRDDNQATGEVGLLRMIASLEKEREKILAAKEDEYAKREECRKQLQKLERQLQKQYAVAEQEFVPLFKNLAGKFLGLELDIQMDSSASFGLELVLEIGGSRRREGFQLSESQRFFVDIALRMALADLICDPECKTGLIIDTPEGSLDIAYETRAGEMFASFVEKGHAIMMTANINTSHLLLALAHRCGRKHMRLSKMTTWTELSQVQKDEAGLFRSAYSHIEEALGTRAKSHHDA